ncbi:MAG TPA: hypothetical protein VMD09_03625 [Solirubrobacteraceae bacterium]|nr:hypothetical protein [Solirubrobacteraceae bacterium]
MPRLGRLWRSGGRRAQVAEASTEEAEASEQPSDAAAPGPTPPEDIGQRLEEARRRLRQTIPPPEE